MGQGGSLQLDRTVGLRFRPLEDAVAEVRGAVGDLAVNHVVVVDSIATLDDRLAQGFVAALADLPGVGVQLNAHVNKFSAALAERLTALGDRASVWFGFESGSDRMLRFLDKGHTAAAAERKARRCLESGARLGVNLLLGVPTETPDDVARTMAFASLLVELEAYEGQVLLNPNILNPLPGTTLYDWCRAEDLLWDPADFSIWTVDRIEQEGRGPLRGVDYSDVVERFRALHAPRPAPWHGPWAAPAT
jgi:radical SAM superfamily enzyme YgiQ (UPF0313 family)